MRAQYEGVQTWAWFVQHWYRLRKKTAAGKADDDRLALFDIPFDEFLNSDLIVGEDHVSIRNTRVEPFREPANYYDCAVFG